MRSSLDSLASALYGFLAKAPRVEYSFRDRTQSRAMTEDDVDVAHFRQSWPNTACMFTGRSTIAGQAFTSAWTTVIWRGETYDVYCNGQHAYGVDRPNEVFLKDLDARNMADQRTGSTRYHDEGARPS
jgi:hypothetical protein